MKIPDIKLLSWVVCLFFQTVHAEKLKVAVASNFEPALNQLAIAFEIATGHEINVISGSTGQLYAQIKHGAPFDVYMAADTHRPELLLEAGLASDYLVYATGNLVFFSNDEFNGQCSPVFSESKWTYLAIADPELAPYGQAAKQYLENLGGFKNFKNHLVMGQNASQAMQMVATGNASAGLVAKSLLVGYELKENQCWSDISPRYYDPIEQAMVLLKRSKQPKLSRAFKEFMLSDAARDIIKTSGY